MGILYDICKSLDLRIKHAVEVGVWKAHTSQCLPFLSSHCRVQLFEPLSEAINDLKKIKGCELHEVAIYDHIGKGDLAVPIRSRQHPCATSAAFIIETSSPWIQAKELKQSPIQDNELKKQTVTLDTFDNYDDGTIEALALDCEGCEWFVLKNMSSRPNIIQIEMRHKDSYVNPYTDEILSWINTNNYTEIRREGADVIYLKSMKERR